MKKNGNLLMQCFNDECHHCKYKNYFNFVENIIDVTYIYFKSDSLIILLNTGEIMMYKNDYQMTDGSLTPKCYDFSKYKIVPGVNNVKKIYKANDNTILLLNDGKIMVQGENTYGELGTGYFGYVKNFSFVPNINNVKKIYFEVGFTFLLLDNGQIMSSGWNYEGQLGQGDRKNKYIFKILCDNKNNIIRNVKKIYTHNSYVFLLLTTGQIMSCGNNLFGNLGLGNKISKEKFGLLQNIKNVKKVYCKNKCTKIILNNGTKMKTNKKNCLFEYY